MYRKSLARQIMFQYNAAITSEKEVSISKSKKGVKAMLFAPKEKGQGLVEYALILVLVAIVVIAVLMLLGPIIGNVFSTINDSLSSF
jgi:pilus assembly protein Flp/PilA